SGVRPSRRNLPRAGRVEATPHPADDRDGRAHRGALSVPGASLPRHRRRDHRPRMVRHCLGIGAEIIGHGISVNRMITSRMSEDEEREYISTSLDALRRATGRAPIGWLGPESGESTRTPRLLAELGIQYVCDWVNDEQPYALNVPRGELYALPIALPVDDVN